MDVRLTIEKGRTRLREVRLRSAQTTVGRQRGCGLRIPSAQVSRRHCLLCIQDGYLTVEDLDSVNGTLLNGQKIRGRQVVRPGDRLEIGPLGFVVQYQLTQDAINHMLEGSAPAEELDVLPVHEGHTATEQPMDLEDIPMALPEEEEEIPMLEPLDDEYQATAAEGWQMPEGEDFQNLLSEMDPSRPEPDQPRRRRRR
jgi:pSer/pThr/pTyr-binding forkhead associated (FHA) protein